MKKILELTNSMSGYGTLKHAFKDDEDKHFYGENEDFDYQICLWHLPSVESLTKEDLDTIDEIRIWYCSKNTNESMFIAVIVYVLEEYRNKIHLIDIVNYEGRPGSHYYCVGELNGHDVQKVQSLQIKLTEEQTTFCEKAICYYFERDQYADSFMMIKGHTIYELPHSEIKEYILSNFENYAVPSHTIGKVMGYEWEEKGWCFGDNVIYKFIADLINEGKIMVQASFHERYAFPPKLFIKP